MNSPKDGGPAFPTGERLDQNGQVEQYHISGMSLRDWFAGMAMQAIIAKMDGTAVIHRGVIAIDAFLIADRMIEKRERKNEE